MSESKLRYLNLDFETHRRAILDRVQARWPGEWNDFLSNSIGMVLVDIIAWSTATIAYAMNRTLGESFTSSMRLRESAIRIASMFGYRLKGPSAARVPCLASLRSALAQDVVIKAGTSVLVPGTDLVFEVDQDYTIAAGNLNPEETVLRLRKQASDGNSREYISGITLTSGSRYADVVDTTIDLRDYAEVGQDLKINGVTYPITEIRMSPTGVNYHRLVLSEAYSGVTLANVEAEIVDRRIGLVHGQTVSDTYATPAVPGSGYVMRLTRTNVVEGSIRVHVGNELWTPVDKLVLAGSEDKVYELRVLPTGYTVVKFGDGVHGLEVTPKTSVVIEYRIGGGSSGNVNAGSINVAISANALGGSSPIAIQLTNNYSAGSGGLDRESVEEARVNIPNYVQANSRAVSLSDYAAIAASFSDPSLGRVKYARAEARSGNSLVEGNIVLVYAWTVGPDGLVVPLSGQFKTALSQYLRQYAVGTDYPMVADGVTKPLPVSTRLRARSGFLAASVEQSAQQALKQLVSDLQPGASVEHAALFRALSEVQGVDHVSLATPTSDLVPSSPNELFVNPTSDKRTVLETMSEEQNAVTYQIPVYPIAPWSIRLFRETSQGTSELQLYPAAKPGHALIVATPTNGLNLDVLSLIDLKTGRVTLSYAEDALPTEVSFSIKPVTAYERVKTIDVWIGYDGINNQPKRREIRAAVREWAQGLNVGGTLFTRYQPNVRASVSNVEDVVRSISGVDDVTRVSVLSPSNTAWRVDAADYELIQLGQVFIQNSAD